MFRKLVTLCFYTFWISITFTTVSFSEIIECRIDKRLFNDRLDLQRKWMPDVTTHDIGQIIKKERLINKTEYSSVILDTNLKGLKGVAVRDYENNRLTMSYSIDLPMHQRARIIYSYKQTPKRSLLKLYASIQHDLLKWDSGKIGMGTCKTRIRKPLKPTTVINLPKKSNEPIKSLEIILTAEERRVLNFNECGLKAKFRNISTKEVSTSILYVDENYAYYGISNEDIKDVFYKTGVPNWANLGVTVVAVDGSNCRVQNTSEINLGDHRSDAGVTIDKLGNVKVMSHRLELMLSN
jgi:hypothetical protein